MINYSAEWKYLSEKIQSLTSLVDYIVPNYLNVNSLPGMKDIVLDSFSCSEHIIEFREKFKIFFSERQLKVFDDFEGKFKELKSKIETTANQGNGHKDYNKNSLAPDVVKLLIALKLAASSITYFFYDNRLRIRKSIEVAFAHLQRQILVDEAVRSHWNEGWKKPKPEVYFEKLGGTHLLLHKILGFKMSADKAITDLVLQEPIREEDVLLKSADGLVLTEWKQLDSGSEHTIKDIIYNAKEQIKNYKNEQFYSIELADCCYIVLVSGTHLTIEKENIEFQDEGIYYRVFNIVCKPSVPSRRKKSTKKQ